MTLFPHDASFATVDYGGATPIGDLLVRSGERRIFLGRAEDAMTSWKGETVAFLAEPVFGETVPFPVTIP